MCGVTEQVPRIYKQQLNKFVLTYYVQVEKYITIRTINFNTYVIRNTRQPLNCVRQNVEDCKGSNVYPWFA